MKDNKSLHFLKRIEGDTELYRQPASHLVYVHLASTTPPSSAGNQHRGLMHACVQHGKCEQEKNEETAQAITLRLPMQRSIGLPSSSIGREEAAQA